MAKKPRKVLVFGMDGADWDIMQPLIDKGDMPTMARLQREGAWGKLASTIHPHSPTAWASFLTGSNPGMHGIFDFVHRKPGTYEMEIFHTKLRGGKSLWQVLSQAGVRCGVMNVPMTHPPEKVNGYFVSGAFTTNAFAKFTYPLSLIDEIKGVIGRNYTVDVHLGDFASGSDDANDEGRGRWLDDLERVERERCDVEVALIQKYNPDFVCHVVTSCDRAQHTFYRYIDTTRADYDPHHKYADCINRTYRTADGLLKKLWDAMGEDTTVIILSDHGGYPLHRALRLNAWLESEGYLTSLAPAQAGPVKRLIKSTLKFAYLGAKKLPRGVRKQIAGRFDIWGLTSMKFLPPTAIDWSQTKASAEGTFGNIRLNVKGLYPQGTVEPGAEYERVVEEIRRKIEKVVDPETGIAPVERTYKRDELYSGERINEAPDIIVVLKPGYQMVGDILAKRFGKVDAVVAKSLFVSGDNNYQLSGIHSPFGVVLARGEGIPANRELQGAHIIDLTPTILRLYGLPVPSSMDGKVLDALVGAGTPAGSGA